VKDVAQLINAMQEAGVISNYALFGATAQMRYTEPVATLDADVLVVLPRDGGLDVLAPIYRFCELRGLKAEGEAIVVGQWPVQFLPVFSPLTAEAVTEAETDDIDGIPVRVVSAAHLAAIALSVGRAKDHLRILSLLEAGATTRDAIGALAARHGLGESWNRFCERHLQ
jgi:hypothetical protein